MVGLKRYSRENSETTVPTMKQSQSVVESLLFSDVAFHQWIFRCVDGPHMTHFPLDKTEASLVPYCD